MSHAFDEDDDFGGPSLAKNAANGLPLLIPWKREARELGLGFDSSHLKTDKFPWTSTQAFEPLSIKQVAFFCEVDGGINSFIEGRSLRDDQSSDHFSGSLSVTIGNSFISGNVTASYDRTVQELSNVSKASRNVTHRAGRIIFLEQPRLSPTAKQILAPSNGGPMAFAKTYGDYYIAGYVLGGDTGVCVAASSSSSKNVETVELSVTVKFLFFSATVKTSHTEGYETADMDMTVVGYDTLEAREISQKARLGESTKPIEQGVGEFMAKAASLKQRVKAKMDSLGLESGASLDGQACSKVAMSGLVVQLILMPFFTLKDYRDISTARLTLSEQFQQDQV